LVCEPEHRPLVFESNEEIEELNHINDLEQLEDLMVEASNETIRSCVFKTNNLCMVVGLEEDKQSFKAVKNMEEYLPEDESLKKSMTMGLEKKYFTTVNKCREASLKQMVWKRDLLTSSIIL